MEQTIQWLNRAFEQEKEIKSLKIELSRMKSLSALVTTHISNVKVQTSIIGSAEDAIISCIEQAEHINKKVEELCQIKTEICEAISCLEKPIHRTLLRMRYLGYMQWKEIAYEMNYSMRSVHYIHKKAVEDISNICAPNCT